MDRVIRWSHGVLSAVLPMLLLSVVLMPARSVGAVGCGDVPQLSAPAAQSQERWRYVYDGGGNYEIVGWSPTEVTLLIDAPGCALSRVALVGLDLISGQERWRVTADQWQGDANMGITTGSGLVILPTSDAIYAYDETTGQQLWSAASNYEWAASIVANENNTIVLSYENSLMALDEGTGALLWQQILPTGSVTAWQNMTDGPLVGIGRPANAGEDVQVFGIDKNSGMLLWQSVVGTTVSSFGGALDLASDDFNLVVATVQTDATSELVALDAATGAIGWTVPIVNDGTYTRVFITRGMQPTVVHASGGPLDVKWTTGYDVATGALRWQNENIGVEAIMAGDNYLIGAGPTLSYLNALVLVDGETGDMIWAQPYALVDGGFFETAQISTGELIFSPSLQEVPAPTVLGVDIASGDVQWSNSYPEFAGLYINGVAAGLFLATGDAATEAVLIAFAP